MWNRCQASVWYAWRWPCFQWASKKKKKPGWGAETTEPLTGPRTMSQPPDQTLPPPPVSSTKTANKVGRLLGGVYRPYPQCGTLWAKPQWFYPWNIHVLYFYIFGKHLSVSLTCFIHNPHCLLSIFVLGFFWGCRQSHHSYGTVPSPWHNL